ncbi:hypothetical protein [Escherichia coli]|nr:hypothetical protein [Escherichia coli]
MRPRKTERSLERRDRLGRFMGKGKSLLARQANLLESGLAMGAVP